MTKLGRVRRRWALHGGKEGWEVGEGKKERLDGVTTYVLLRVGEMGRGGRHKVAVHPDKEGPKIVILNTGGLLIRQHISYRISDFKEDNLEEE